MSENIDFLLSREDCLCYNLNKKLDRRKYIGKYKNDFGKRILFSR